MTNKLPWYQRDTNTPPLPVAEVPTPIGIVKFKILGAREATFTFPDGAGVNGIRYKVDGALMLHRLDEEWRITSWHVVRIGSDRAPTRAAFDQVRAVSLGTWNAWAEANWQRLGEAQRTANAERLARAHHRLDSVLEQVEERRNELHRLEAELTSRPITDDERAWLDDLWGHHWRFV